MEPVTTPANQPAVLDMIDHAIDDWETSPDAMRWTPDPPPVLKGPDIARLFDVPPGFIRLMPSPALEPWQVDVLRRQFEDFGTHLRATVEPVVRQFGDAMKGRSLTIRPILDEVYWREARRPQRVTQLRRAYRVKRGRRW